MSATILYNALATASLTTGFGSPSAVVRVSPSTVVLLISYVKGTGTETSLQLRLEISDDGVSWYLPTSSGGADISQVYSASAGGAGRLNTNIALASGEQYVRLTSRIAGTPGGNGTVTVKLLHNPHPSVF